MKLDTKFLAYIKDIQESTNQALQNLSIPDEPKYLYEPVRYVLRGKGKRLRPILVHLVCEAFDVKKEDKIQAGLAVELLHNFTLIHDDIMDDDNFRHGQQTIHKKWDESTAILAGDGVYILSQFLIAKVSVNVVEAMNIFNQATLTVCEGQAFDKMFEKNENVTLNEYLQMIEKKTGVLLGVCAELGGVLSNQSSNVNNHLKSFGINLGKAFQIQDDMLEIFSDKNVMGKSLGSDLTEGKQTALTIFAREKHPEEWVKIKAKMMTEGTEKAVQIFRDWFESRNLISEVNSLISKYVEIARNEINILPKEKQHYLEQFTELVLNRKN